MITVSMTSLPNRLHIAQYALKSIELQTLQADRIVLNIDKEHFRSVDEVRDRFTLPLDLERIKINLTNDIGPHTKLLPILRAASGDDPIVTIDDDILYSPLFLEKIMHCAELNEDCIICSRARKITRNIFGGYQVYHRWPYAKSYEKGMDLLPLGVGGVLYRKSFFKDQTLFDKDLILCAPHADDLSFKALGILNGVSVIVDPEINLGGMDIGHPHGLMGRNWESGKPQKFLSKGIIGRRILSRLQYLGFCGNRNDIQWRQLQEAYPSLEDMFK